MSLLYMIDMRNFFKCKGGVVFVNVAYIKYCQRQKNFRKRSKYIEAFGAKADKLWALVEKS